MNWVFGILLLVLSAGALLLIFKISGQMNDRLNQMNQALQESNKIISQNLGSTVSAFGNVKEQLGKLEVTNRQIVDISRNISSLQELLRAPKFRGAMGETLLENLLSQVLPKQHYMAQYRFKTGDTVDAVIKLGERLVTVDAKFSLENFQKMLDTDEEQSKALFRKKFIQDVKNRIDEVSSKYILPAENTYDFALMYIPAENVYYEVIVKEDVFSYALSKKVIPVSPNTFYAYLQVICLGLKGLEVEENAKAILKSLSALGIEVDKFKEEFDILGGHLNNANAKYLDSSKRLVRLTDKFVNIQEHGQIEGGK
ncbi:MAG: DNA recombination protein RmuC [Candidatus Omnitrophica bacterium]|jgi:DNA recombination protein RmuC|nr:DNA recombination protein RmuC [Candidatus Omnitrophota bacterium]MDD3987806.1 DNA recombination protein RmuC [Candidatus Omnitrophota bacterium]MDD4981200.1 DNA recombination protein RmuC [Candidatus Omnitrophota bacterium]MDD5664710.1 DNA recombination protein RmuC [Candidatus Omnitrophota bacterium]